MPIPLFPLRFRPTTNDFSRGLMLPLSLLEHLETIETCEIYLPICQETLPTLVPPKLVKEMSAASHKGRKERNGELEVINGIRLLR